METRAEVVASRSSARESLDAATAALLERRERSGCDRERRQLLSEAVELNIAFAQAIARRFGGRGVEVEDLEQVALLGLVRAVHRYRPAEETPFTAYAAPTISGEVKRYFRDSAWMVRIPRRLQELQSAIAACLPALEQALGRTATADDIAAAVDSEAADVAEALAAVGCFDVVSLDRPGDMDATPALAEVLTAEEDAALRQLEDRDAVLAVLDKLAPRQRRILQLRFLHGRTQAEIGADVGLSQIQVSRILSKTLRELREDVSA
ncbi:sigma-70 family RNA polymerase sigma factor [Kribbella sp. CA-293567]|uniref:sigma-70 family RNA polymerase sigma factor n=1 Tax=Kribbella sp. CA-293567 TaxID=3002436 RepID=UPI0022DE1A40|nr:sigma-70 family RNA polymerase sigma factor [Kribbella sp. CA-293567]WBQ04473.1 sigma-70 family RNA polymerase sigma factor [Kribbella sp. CA-293567]